MATLFVDEFASWVSSPGGDVDRAPLPPITTQRLTIGASSAATNALNVATRLVRLSMDSGVCNIVIGASGAAVTGSTGMRFAQTVGELFGVPAGQTGTFINAITAA